MNNQNKEINETIKRTKRYWYVDGFSEIGIGLVLIVIILFNHAASQVHQPVMQIILFVFAMPLLIYLCSRGLNWGVKRLKEQITYPRSGYVAYSRKTGSQRWKRALQSGIIGAVVGAVTAFFSGALPSIYQHIFVTLIIVLAYTYIGYTIGLVRFYLIAAATLALMAILLTINVSSETLLLWFFIGQGSIWIVSGISTLYTYLRTTQAPLDDES